MHSGEKSNNCNQCDFASVWAGNLNTQLKRHSGEKSNKCNQCDYASSRADSFEGHEEAVRTLVEAVNESRKFEASIVAKQKSYSGHISPSDKGSDYPGQNKTSWTKYMLRTLVHIYFPLQG